MWLEYNGDGTWSAPALKNYKGAWECEGGADIDNLSGVLSFSGVGNVVQN